MTRKKPSPSEIHEEMLRHLASNPPPKRRSAAAKPRTQIPTKAPTQSRSPVERPTLMLRRLRQHVALEILAQRVQLHARMGHGELLVIVGKGKGSPRGESVLGPLVRAWCDAHGQWVQSVHEAPEREGGSGALILRLRKPS